MTMLKKAVTFPYEFGRVYPVAKTNEVEKDAFVRNAFGSETIDGFIFAYKNIIEALNESDIGYLKENLENNLTKDLVIPTTQLVNPESEVTCRILNMGFVLGARFDRLSTPGYGNLLTQDLPTSLIQMKIYIPKSFKGLFNMQPIPLFWVTVEFSTAYKLIR